LQENRLLFRRLATELDALGLQRADERAVAGLRVIGDELIPVASFALDDLPFQGDRIDAVAFDFGEKLRVVDGGRLAGAHSELTENREQNDRQRDP
jgi:hypothetical protein